MWFPVGKCSSEGHEFLPLVKFIQNQSMDRITINIKFYAVSRGT